MNTQQSLLNLAATHASAGRLKHAAAAYQQILRDDPEEPQALFGLGELFGRLGQLFDALRYVSRAVEHSADRPSYQLYYAQLLLDVGDNVGALDAADRLLRKQPQSARGHCLRATALGRLGRTDRAIRLIGEVLSRSPNDVDASFVQGELLQRGGFFEEALSHYRSRIGVWHDADATRRAQTHIGWILDRLGRYDESFETFRARNAARAADAMLDTIDRHACETRIMRYERLITRDVVARWATIDVDVQPAPIFIVGTPRAGEHLIADLLDATGETRLTEGKPLVQRTLQELERLRPGVDVIESLCRLEPGDVAHLRRYYRKQASMLLNANPSTDRLVDTAPLTIIDIAAIHALFPDASIVVAERDLRDVCLSCFRHRERVSEGTVHFLDWSTTAAFVSRLHGFRQSMMSRWHDVSIIVPYEQLVANYEVEAERLIRGVGLDWSQVELAMHEGTLVPRAEPADADIICRPAFEDSAGLWRSYAAPIAEIAEHLSCGWAARASAVPIAG